jgi:hypothetical protein
MPIQKLIFTIISFNYKAVVYESIKLNYSALFNYFFIFFFLPLERTFFGGTLGRGVEIAKSECKILHYFFKKEKT